MENVKLITFKEHIEELGLLWQQSLILCIRKLNLRLRMKVGAVGFD